MKNNVSNQYYLLEIVYILKAKGPRMSWNFFLHQGRLVNIESLRNQPQCFVVGSEY
jgi:hypothetical protein